MLDKPSKNNYWKGYKTWQNNKSLDHLFELLAHEHYESESLDFRPPPFSHLYSIRFFYSLEMQHKNGKQHELVPTLILFCRFVFAFVTSSKVHSSLKINSGLNSLGLSQDNRICQLVPPEFARRTFLTSAGKTLLVFRVVFDVAQWNANLTSSVQIPPRPLGKQSWAIWPVLMTPGKSGQDFQSSSHSWVSCTSVPFFGLKQLPSNLAV